MLSEKIQSVRMALGVLSGKVHEEEWQFLKLCRAELADAADLASELESQAIVQTALTRANEEVAHGQA